LINCKNSSKIPCIKLGTYLQEIAVLKSLYGWLMHNDDEGDHKSS
jgi:hypothetical protein